MRRKHILTGAVILCLLCGWGLQAQQSDSSAADNPDLSAASQPASGTIPRLIKFRGEINPQITQIAQLKESEGGKNQSPTVLGVTFSLYELPEGGSPLWSESQKVQVDEQGGYTVFLGANCPEGLPLDLFTSSKALWLGVQPQLPGQPEQPRVLLVAVPYALKSSDADTLGGLPASAYMLAPSGNAVQAITVPPPITIPPPKVGATSSVPITGAGTPNFAAMFTGSATIGNSAIYNSLGGMVGIGTTSPAATLDVRGTGNFSSALSAMSFTGMGAGLTALNPANLSAGTAGINITGNAGTATSAITANNALSLGGNAASAFPQLTANNTFSGNNTFQGNNVFGGTTFTGGVTGNAADFSGEVTAAGIVLPATITGPFWESRNISRSASASGEGAG